MIAILHAPNRKASVLPQLMRKMKDVVEDYGLPQTNILVNPSKLQIGSYPSSAMKNVAIGWGETEKPSWDALITAYDLTYIPHLMCFNLNERLGIDGKLLVYWPGITSEYWGRKVQRGQQRLFRDGYYVRAIVPYGLTKIAIKTDNAGKGSSKSRYLLAPGDQEEVEIVQLIYSLYVYGEHSLTDISNLLSAQRIKSPGYNAPWTWGNVKKVLENPLYIGANQFGKSIIYDVFDAILEKSIYFEAQAKLNREVTAKAIAQQRQLEMV